MNKPPLIFIVFFVLSTFFFLVRNIYYLRLWKYRYIIEDKNQLASLFPPGFNKLMEPLKFNGLLIDKKIIPIIKRINFYSYCFIISFLLCVFLTFFESLVI